MRFLLRLILVAAIGYGAGLWLPMWNIPITMGGAFLVGLVLSRARKKRVFGNQVGPAYAFASGFLALLLVWGILAWQQDSLNGGILSERIAAIFAQNTQGATPTGPEGSQLLMLISALIGGLVGGLSTMTGNLLGEAIKS